MTVAYPTRRWRCPARRAETTTLGATTERCRTSSSSSSAHPARPRPAIATTTATWSDGALTRSSSILARARSASSPTPASPPRPSDGSASPTSTATTQPGVDRARGVGVDEAARLAGRTTRARPGPLHCDVVDTRVDVGPPLLGRITESANPAEPSTIRHSGASPSVIHSSSRTSVRPPKHAIVAVERIRVVARRRDHHQRGKCRNGASSKAPLGLPHHPGLPPSTAPRNPSARVGAAT